MRRLHTYLLTALLSLLALAASGQSQNRNYVMATTMLDSLGNSQAVSVQYYDTFGYPDLKVEETETGFMSGKQEYNARRLDFRRWCSYPVGSSPLAVYDDSDAYDFHEDWDPYGETRYDSLDRPRQLCGGGEDWYSADKFVTKEYRVNAANSVKRYTAPLGSTSLSSNGKYPAGTLSCEKTTDEDGHTLEVFRDNLGRTVLERRDGSNDTYYVYNALGLLRFVLSPQYQHDGTKSKYAYEYRYDARRRVVKKILPGCTYIQYWYDKGDRLMFMQDARLRAANRYRFYCYDKAGRLAVQGTCSDCNRGTYHAFVTFSGNGGGLCGTGYILQKTGAVTDPELELCNYYDGYAFLSLTAYSGQQAQLQRTAQHSAKGLPTGTVSVASNGERLYSATYYDFEGRPSEVRSIGLDGRLQCQTTAYTFTGQPDETTAALTVGTDTYTASTAKTYSGRTGRLTASDLSVGGGSAHRTSLIAYDGIGRLSSLTRSGSAGAVSYAYNVRGWTTGITSPQFTEQLYYQNQTPSTACYNGNVSAVQWTAASESVTRGYKLLYDGLNRLTTATYGEGSSIGDNAGRYTEKVTAYTANGAITALERYGRLDNGTFGKVDDLTVTLNGNKLKKVTDSAPALHYNGAFNFNDGADLTTEYTYDNCGSLTSDANKGIAWIDYDLSGMPRRIQFTNASVTEYVYSPQGEKLRTVHRTAVADLSVPIGSTLELTAATTLSADSTDYCGSFLLRNGSVDRYLFDSGYCQYPQNATPSSQPSFHYYTRDHLGNNRTVVSEDGLLEQVTHYYPFGGIYGDATYNAGLQPYKYNGKELDHTHGLDWYDYGARNYDAALAVWNGADKLAEKYYDVSLYAYCANNPVIYIDYNGDFTMLYSRQLNPYLPQKFAVHTFVVVYKIGMQPQYFAYGPNDINSALERCYYEDDLDIIYNGGNNCKLDYNAILVSPPIGMTEEEFDNKVIESAALFGNVDDFKWERYTC